MTFTAIVIRNSAIWRQWTAQTRTGGELWGVPFHWVVGGEFITDVLTADQVIALTGKPDILLEMAGEAVPPTEPPTGPPTDPPHGGDPGWEWGWSPEDGWHPVYVPEDKPQPPPVAHLAEHVAHEVPDTSDTKAHVAPRQQASHHGSKRH